VLAGNNMGPSKKQKAEDLKVEIITEEEFLAKIS
jgi:DNA ligase (NAD+)